MPRSLPPQPASTLDHLDPAPRQLPCEHARILDLDAFHRRHDGASGQPTSRRTAYPADAHTNATEIQLGHKLNLAFADVRVLFEGIDSWASTGSRDLLDQYSDRALQRIWKAQNFSYWMTSMLHVDPHSDQFGAALQLSQLRYVISSRAAATTLAENYTGYFPLTFPD